MNCSLSKVKLKALDIPLAMPAIGRGKQGGIIPQRQKKVIKQLIRCLEVKMIL